MSNNNTIKNHFNELIEKGSNISYNALDELFSELPPISINEMFGLWELGYLFTDRPKNTFETFLKYFPIRLYGKRLRSKNNVHAWVLSFLGLKFDIPISSCILEMIEYRDKLSTSMIYNYFPMIDHFRKVDDSLIMGIMEIKGNVSVYFYLKNKH